MGEWWSVIRAFASAEHRAEALAIAAVLAALTAVACR
jgi:hypothetical protein